MVYVSSKRIRWHRVFVHVSAVERSDVGAWGGCASPSIPRGQAGKGRRNRSQDATCSLFTSVQKRNHIDLAGTLFVKFRVGARYLDGGSVDEFALGHIRDSDVLAMLAAFISDGAIPFEAEALVSLNSACASPMPRGAGSSSKP